MISKPNFKQNERGRSMVEMLGVLAVIGVLSFGGIQGYKYAMDKHRANDIVNEVNLRATDIWHLYQDGEKELPDSPEEDAFPEYGEVTQTGFPIMVTTHPNAYAFKTWVDNVPVDVCKKVLNENLEDAIVGLQFVHVENINEAGEGSGLVRFREDDTICGEKNTLNQMVFTSFLDEGGGATPCSEDYDCDESCCNGFCDLNTLTCRDSCSISDKVCNKSTCECVECWQDEDCPSNGQVCDPATNQCVTVPEKCGEGERFGKEYRAKNGACVPCTYISEVLIMNSDDNDGIFEVEVAGKVVKDTRSGIDMCRACQDPTHRVEGAGSGASKQTYCATGCIIGNTFLSKSKGCTRCDSLTEIEIADEDQARAQCLACPNRIWFEKDNTYKCVLKNCPNGYFKNNGVCRKCKLNPDVDCYSSAWPACYDYYAAVVWRDTWTTSAGSMKSTWEAECDRCGIASDSNLKEQHHVVGAYCPRKCAGKGIQFQDFYGSCYDCDTDASPSLILNGMTREYLNELCNACEGREIVGWKCVKKNASTCLEGQFKGADYKCYPCDHPSGVTVNTTIDSGCETTCGEKRYIDSDKEDTSNDNTKWCMPKCPAKHIMKYSGACVSCDDIGNAYNLGWKGEGSDTIHNLCKNACGENANKLGGSGGYVYCVPTDCGENRMHASSGECKNCITSGTLEATGYQTECEACGNHIFLNNYCTYYNPSVSGVCNNDSPNTSKFPNYPAGEGVYYRDITGMCRECQDSTTAYEATQEECDSCGGIRRLANKQCVYGGCTDGVSFVTSTGCKGCDTKTVKVKTHNSAEAKHLCEQCGRRVMTVHLSEETYESYCVQECDVEEWQDIAGECHAGIMDSSDGKNEIGSDDVSINKCHNSGRVVEQEGNQFFCEEKETTFG